MLSYAHVRPSSNRINNNPSLLRARALQREAKIDNNETIHDGARFIEEIRQEIMHPAIKNIPIIVYSAFRDRSVNVLKRHSVTNLKNIKLCDTIEELVTNVVSNLVEIRSNPIKVQSRKKATSPYNSNT
jgi:hypothetical protein